MELLDSRRLTGVNILWDRPGAVIDAAVPDAQQGTLVQAWEYALRRRLEALGWHGESSCVRVYPGGLSLALSAPLDALYAATEVNESAWRAAVAQVLGEQPEDFESEAVRLHAEIAGESNPPLLVMAATAREHGVQFLTDDDLVTVGLGCGSRTWAVGEVPDPEQVDWQAVHDVPTAMITGTNGKTTTVRLLASIAAAAGKCAGLTSTDGVSVGSEILDEGDWSGPGGARIVLRHPGTQVALLETARGGMLRRGLALGRCEVAAVLNVDADHLGEWGVGTVDALAEGKFIVTRIAGSVVLNADDEVVVRQARGRARALTGEIVWFSLDPAQALLEAHLTQGGRAAVLDEGVLWLRHAGERREVLGVDDIPCTLGGAARYNVANALAAAAVAERMGFTLTQIRSGLSRFDGDQADNPGRLNRFRWDGVQAIVDFAHNPHGFRALFELANAMPATRRLVLLGQAGDRDEQSIREMARITWDARPDMIVIKELPSYLRGRELGEVPAFIEAELRVLGVPPERFVHCGSELEAVDWALDWAEAGDLLLLLTHEKRAEVLSRLEQLEGRVS